MKLLTKLLIVLALASGYGCAGGPAESTAASEPPVSTPDENSPSMTPPVPSIPQSLIEKAMQDMAQRLSVPANGITLVEAMAVTWPDSSLGCPQEGFAYAQVLTPGYLIVLEYADNRYEYHASRGTEVVYCQNPQPPVPGDPGNT